MQGAIPVILIIAMNTQSVISVFDIILNVPYIKNINPLCEKQPYSGGNKAGFRRECQLYHKYISLGILYLLKFLS